MNDEKKVGLIGLVALTVSSVVGGGIFNIMSDVAKVSSVGPAIIAIIISGSGMGIFVMCLQNLTNKLPHLEAGVYSFAQEGFGSFAGFNSAMGFWLSMFLGNVALGSLCMSALGYFFPLFGDGQNVYAVLFASVILWMMHLAISKGSDFANKINGIITAAKLIPLCIFILTLIIAFDYNMFTKDFWGTINNNFDWNQVGPQVSKSMVFIVWMFVGVEGATVYSARANSKKIVSKATVLSFAIITSIYLLTLVMSFAVMTRENLANLDKPAMAFVMESVVGKWGAVMINAGVVISALGAWFACTMFSGEVLFQAAKSKIFPRFLAYENKYNAPTVALLLSNGLVQFFLLSLLVNKSAYNLMALLASSTMLIPYFFISITQVKLSWRWDNHKLTKNLIFGIIASIYMVYCIFASGYQYVLATTLLFAPGMFLYVIARKENSERVFSKAEFIAAIAIMIMATISIVFIANGNIDIAEL